MLLHGPTPMPDPRIMRRVAWLLRRGGGPVAFATAGRGLAQAIVGSRGGPMPEWVDELADAMIRSLILVQVASEDTDEPDFRTQLALSAGALSLVRPEHARRCDEAIAGWLGTSLEPVAGRDCATAAAFALHALWHDDEEGAAAAVTALVDRSGCGAGWALHDWMVARAQRHGVARELECFHHLRLSLRGEPPSRSAPLLVLFATIVLWERLGVPRGRALAWLDEVATSASVVPTRAAS